MRSLMNTERKHRWLPAGFWTITAVVICAAITLIVWRAWPNSWSQYPHVDLQTDRSPPFPVDGAAESRIKAFCADCHTLPNPGSFPRDRWHDAVRKGYEFYARSGRNDLEPPPVHQTVAWFRSLAPDELVFPKPEEAETEMPVAFTVELLDWGEPSAVPPGVSYLRWASIGDDREPILLVCDMRDGCVAAVDPGDPNRRVRVLTKLDHPCRAEACDLDGNGATDLVVADLGSVRAIDHDLGRVVWLRRSEDRESPEEIVLASGLGRVADVRPADFDGDGDLDLLVAEFGHYRTGGILLLRNVAARGEPPRFQRESIDSRPGTIHVPLHDFNGDGRPDFAALISQEHECVEIFVNQNDAHFSRYAAWAGPDLTFGSSAIQLVDMDQDGDMDVLYTNGDAFDNSYANPSHGVQWLENLGRLEFACRRLADLPGAYCAMAGDVDLDGDLDIIVTTWLPQQVKPRVLSDPSTVSILCLEQKSPGRFVRHTLERGAPRHAAMEMADFDGDGDLDFAVGYHAGLPRANAPRDPRAAIWWNQAISKNN